MRFEGVFEVGAPKTRVFETVADPRRVAGCMPDLQRLEVRSQDEFDAVVKVGVSLIRGEFALRFRIVEKKPPISLKMKGHGAGLGSAVDMDILVEVSDGAAGGTSMRWAAEVAVSGRIASLGQRLMESQAEKIVKQFFGCFERQLEGP